MTGRCTLVASWVLVLALLLGIAGCSSDPPPSPVPSTRAPVDYVRLEGSIEDAIVADAMGVRTTRAVLVSVGGQTRVAHYRAGGRPEAALHVWSVTQNVVAALVGIAIADGVLPGLDATLPELLPTYVADMSAEQKTVTLRQLMAMTAGFPYDSGTDRINLIFDGRGDPDPTRKILTTGLDTPPGLHYFSSPSAHLVSAALRAGLARTDGDRPRTVLQYAEQELFRPLGIDTSPALVRPVRLPDPAFEASTSFGWGTDRSGLHSACCLLRLRTSDVLKIGELYLARGRWQGRQLLPAGWVEETTRIAAGSNDHGLLWFNQRVDGHETWVNWGRDGQLVAVVPDRQLVVAVGSVATGDDAISDSDLFFLLSRVILPALG